MKAQVSFLTLCFFLIPFCIGSAGDDSGNCQVMPDELVHLAGIKGFVQVDEFYSLLNGVTDAPFVYGYKKDKERQCSAAFWCKDTSKTNARVQLYNLVFAERETIWDFFEVKDAVSLSTIGGLCLRNDTTTFLSEFWQVNKNETALENINLQDYVVESYYDGNTVYFYRYQNQTFMYYEMD